MVIPLYVPAWAAVSVVWTADSLVLRATDVDTDANRRVASRVELALVVSNAARGSVNKYMHPFAGVVQPPPPGALPAVVTLAYRNSVLPFLKVVTGEHTSVPLLLLICGPCVRAVKLLLVIVILHSVCSLAVAGWLPQAYKEPLAPPDE
jgi:hypothetical protein